MAWRHETGFNKPSSNRRRQHLDWYSMYSLNRRNHHYF
jgi:hypothetical protein